MEKHNDNNNTSKQVLLSVLGVAILIVAVVGISFAAFSYSKAGEIENTIATGSVVMNYTEATNGINIENAIPMTETQGKALTSDNEMFDFTVDATIVGKTAIDYEIVAVKANRVSDTVPADWNNGLEADGKTQRPVTADDPYDEFVDDSEIRLYLEKKNPSTNAYEQIMAPKAFVADGSNSTTGSAPADSMILTTGVFDNTAGNNNGVKQIDSYRLRMWVDTAYQLDGHIRKYTVKVNVYGKGRD